MRTVQVVIFRPRDLLGLGLEGSGAGRLEARHAHVDGDALLPSGHAGGGEGHVGQGEGGAAVPDPEQVQVPLFQGHPHQGVAGPDFHQLHADEGGEAVVLKIVAERLHVGHLLIRSLLQELAGSPSCIHFFSSGTSAKQIAAATKAATAMMR